MALRDIGKKRQDEIRPGAYGGKPMDGLFGPRGLPVEDSEDLQRILRIPRRTPVDLESAEALVIVERETRKYARDRTDLGPCECRELDPLAECITTLLPVQAVTLREISMAQGLWGSISVGGGKSIIGILALLALENCPMGLLLVPAQLMQQFVRQYRILSQHFRVPSVSVHMPTGDWPCASPTGETQVLHVMSHNGVSSPRQSDFIERINPDVIIIDEGDAFADLQSSRTIRLVRYFQEHGEGTKLCVWTGSASDSEIEEFAHLMVFALKERAPIPIATTVVQDWGRCINAVDTPCPAGALAQLIGPEDEGENETAQVRAAFGRRLRETLGVIMTSSADVEITGGEGLVGVEINERPAPVLPDIIEQALALVRSGERPDTLVGNDHGEIFDDPKEQVKCARDVATGLFHRWNFPRREPREVIDRWFEVRSAYNAEKRALIMKGQRHLDSPKLCEIAAKRFYGEMPIDHGKPTWESKFYRDWAKVRDTVQPQPVVCRLHDFLILDAIEWAREHQGIVWYSTVEFGAWMAELSGLPVYGGGKDAEAQIERLIKSPGKIGSVIASINSHGRGRDGLQRRYAEQLIVNVLASSKRNQQLHARLHRRGQTAETVRSWIYIHTAELRSAHMQAIRRSDYVEAVLLQRQKLKMGLRS